MVGGRAEFRTLAAAEEHARKLEAFWPGLQLRMFPAKEPVIRHLEKHGAAKDYKNSSQSGRESEIDKL